MSSDSPATIDPQILIPVGIVGASMKPLPKLVALYLWHQSGCFHRPFHCHPGEVLSWFAVRGPRASERAFAVLIKSGMINVREEHPGGRILVDLTQNIWRVNIRSPQPSLELFEPPAQFGGNPFLPRLLVPEAFLGSPTASVTQKLVGWCVLWRGIANGNAIRLDYSEFSRLLGMDRANLRKAIVAPGCRLRVELTEFFDCLDLTGAPLLRCSSDRFFSNQQKQNLRWLSSSNLLAAKTVWQLLYGGEVDCAPVLPHVPGSVHEIPRGEVDCAPVLPHARGSVHQIPRGEVDCAPVLPQSVPHSHDMDIDNMSCGTGDEPSRVAAREQFILSFAAKVDFSKTRRYMIRAWALMVETDLITDCEGHPVSVTPEFCQSILDEAACRRYSGGFIAQQFSGGNQGGKSIEWRRQAAEASTHLGLEFGREMRDEVGGSPVARPSRAVRGGDQRDDWDKQFDELYAAFRRERIPHADAVAKVYEILGADKC